MATRVRRQEAVFADPRHRARFEGPGGAAAAAAVCYLLINAGGDKLDINASGDNLRTQ